MLVRRQDAVELNRQEYGAVAGVSEERLRRVVESLSYPRHYEYNRRANVKARDWLLTELQNLGLRVSVQGEYDNVVGEWGDHEVPSVLLGAHYDTVPTTPGADDNTSAIAVCLEAAKVLVGCSDVNFRVVIFNCEEDGLLGSLDYVENMTVEERVKIKEAHIFEMVGYFTSEPDSQGKPEGMPVSLPNQGNFLGLVSNSKSNRISKKLRNIAKSLGLKTPVVSLETLFGIEKVFTDLLRSDHTPFWQAGIPAIMWTDTSEFRNPHYHAPTDKPETLNYSSMADVTRLAVQRVLDLQSEK